METRHSAGWGALLFLTGLFLIILKVTFVPEIPWWVALLPWYISAIFFLLVLLFSGVFIAIGAVFIAIYDRITAKRRNRI